MRRTAAAVIATIGLLAMAAPAQGQSIRYVDEDAGAGVHSSTTEAASAGETPAGRCRARMRSSIRTATRRM